MFSVFCIVFSMDPLRSEIKLYYYIIIIYYSDDDDCEFLCTRCFRLDDNSSKDSESD